jgi:hypothetical protein
MQYSTKIELKLGLPNRSTCGINSGHKSERLRHLGLITVRKLCERCFNGRLVRLEHAFNKFAEN